MPPEQIDAWTRSVELANEIESRAREVAPIVRLVVEIDAAVGVELKRRLCARYAEEHLDVHGLALPLLQRICAAILGHVLQTDDALRIAQQRVRLSDDAFDETVRQIKAFWASSLDEWAPQEALSVKLVLADAALADEVKRRVVAARAATYPYRSDGDDRRIANALAIFLNEAIARLSVIGDSEAKAA